MILVLDASLKEIEERWADGKGDKIKDFKISVMNKSFWLLTVHSFWFIRNMAKEVEYSDFLNFATVSVLKFLRYFLFSEKFSEYSEKF